MPGSLLVVGNINIETTLLAAGEFPIEYTPVNYRFFGINSRVSGVGYNLAKALKTLAGSFQQPEGRGETQIRFATLVANDLPGKMIQQVLAEEGLLSDAVAPLLAQSPQSVVIYDQSGRRQVNTDLKDLQTQVYPPALFDALLEGCELAIITNINYARPLLRAARSHQVKIACDVQDIARLDNPYDQDFLEFADIIFMSHEKLPCAPQAWASQIQARFGTPLVVVGLGSQGVLLLDRQIGAPVHVPAVQPRPVVNTAGAGDALMASFIHAYTRSHDSVRALQKAVLFAGYKIGARSASEGFLDANALEMLYKQHQPPAFVEIAGAPPIEGLRYRFAGGAADAQSLRAVHLERAGRDQLDPASLNFSLPSLDEMQAALAAVENDHQLNQRLVAEVHGQVVGYTNLESWLEGDQTWVYLNLGWVLPDWRGRGIGASLLHFMEQRSANLAQADHPWERAEYAANASSTEHDSAELLLAEGYAPAYTVLEMGLASDVILPEPDLPAGFKLLPVTLDQYVQIALSVTESYENEYPGGRYAERVDAHDYALSLSKPEHDRSLWQVAWDGGVVAGQALSIIRGSQAEVFEVSVRPAYRRRGLARALLLHALHALRQRSVAEIRLNTVAEFPTRARDLYSSVGFCVLKEYLRYRKAMPLHPQGKPGF